MAKIFIATDLRGNMKDIEEHHLGASAMSMQETIQAIAKKEGYTLRFNNIYRDRNRRWFASQYGWKIGTVTVYMIDKAGKCVHELNIKKVFVSDEEFLKTMYAKHLKKTQGVEIVEALQNKELALKKIAQTKQELLEEMNVKLAALVASL